MPAVLSRSRVIQELSGRVEASKFQDNLMLVFWQFSRGDPGHQNCFLKLPSR